MTDQDSTKATTDDHKFDDRIVAGAWKFRHKGGKTRFGVTREELLETAKALILAKIGSGKFLQVFIRGTGTDEIGICFMYELGVDEVSEIDDLKAPYVDFFMRRHGVAYKGYDIGIGVYSINLGH